MCGQDSVPWIKLQDFLVANRAGEHRRQMCIPYTDEWHNLYLSPVGKFVREKMQFCRTVSAAQRVDRFTLKYSLEQFETLQYSRYSKDRVFALLTLCFDYSVNIDDRMSLG
jgi:hypothetical protein